MLLTTGVHDERPKHLSIAASMQFLANSWLPAARASKPSIEPRAIKRRPTKHDLLTSPGLKPALDGLPDAHRHSLHCTKQCQSVPALLSLPLCR